MSDTPPPPLVGFPLKEQQEEERSGKVWECLYIVATAGELLNMALN